MCMILHNFIQKLMYNRSKPNENFTIDLIRSTNNQLNMMSYDRLFTTYTKTAQTLLSTIIYYFKKSLRKGK